MFYLQIGPTEALFVCCHNLFCVNTLFYLQVSMEMSYFEVSGVNDITKNKIMENAQNNKIETFTYSQAEYMDHTCDEHVQENETTFIKCIEISYSGINTFYDNEDNEDILKASLINIPSLLRWKDRNGRFVEQVFSVWLPSKGIESVTVEVDAKKKVSKTTLSLNGFGKKVLMEKLTKAEIAHLKNNNGEIHRTKKPW